MSTLLEATPETTPRPDTISPEVKLHQILNDGLAAVGATGGALMLVDPTGKHLEIWARLGPPHRREMDPKFPVGEDSATGIAGQVAHIKKPYLCVDVTRDPFFLPTRAGPPNFRSLLVVPVFSGERVIGVISADHETENAFTQEHVKTLCHYAGQMAVALAREFERSRLHETLIGLHEVGALLTRLSGKESLAGVLQMVVSQARDVLGAGLVTLYQYEAGSGEFLVEGTGPTIAGELLYHDAPMKTGIYPDDVARKIVEQGSPRFFTNADRDEFLTGFVPARDGQEARPRFAVREKIKSVAALILRTGDETVGVMFVNYRVPHEFTADERRVLETFANYAAIAIQNTRLIRAIREEAREQLVAMERLAVLNSIAPTFAHKMANAAGTIPAAAQEIRRKLESPGQYVQFQLDRIETDARELLEMATQLRQSLQAGPPEPINLYDLLQSIAARTAASYPAMSVDLQVLANSPQVRGIRSQLREVFLNLVRNAAEAILPDPGNLTIRACSSEDGRFLDIEFCDTGRGIQREHQRRLFDLGFTTKPTRGMGFGLWWCQTVLRSQGGDIRLKRSQPGADTTFVVRLPVSQ